MILHNSLDIVEYPTICYNCEQWASTVLLIIIGLNLLNVNQGGCYIDSFSHFVSIICRGLNEISII